MYAIPLIGTLVLLLCFFCNASASAYSPRTNEELWQELSVDLPVACAQHGTIFTVERTADYYPYIGPEPVTLPVVHVRRKSSSATAESLVFIACGFDARGFVTTDVCMTFLQQLCSKSLPSDDLEYLVVPYVNERGRDLVIHLWPEMTGRYSRTYFDMLSQVPLRYHRTARFLFTGTGKDLHLEHILPTVQCFDGSERMTLLASNWGAGWQAREDVVQMQSYDFLSASDLATMDRISTHGRLPYSDPETRILQAIMQKHLPDIFIEVALGTPAVLAPFDSAALASSFVTSTLTRSHYDESVAQALSMAKHHCPEEKCLGGAASTARANVDVNRVGTIADYALTLGASRTFILQVLANRQPDQLLKDATSSNIVDCVRPKLLESNEQSREHALKWSHLLEQLARVAH